MKKKLKPFISFTDMDSITINCPCGEGISGEGDCIVKFIKQHRKHTNKTMKDTITDDGMRAFTQDASRISIFKV